MESSSNALPFSETSAPAGGEGPGRAAPARVCLPTVDSKGTESIVLAPGDERLLVRAAKVEVIAGPDRGRSAALRSGGLVIGSAPDCDLALTDRAVSSRHLEIQASGDGFLLRDMGSTNGTRVGDLKVQLATMTGPVEIALGRTRLRFVPGEEQESFPLSPRESFGSMLGKSLAMRRCFALLERAAQTDSSVLLEGESGTGKEVAAESVHQASRRANGPFAVVDCGAVAENLIESELFGHERGAFSGASTGRIGAFEQADGGTLFLDEIGDLPLAMQPRLLRFLERREVRRVGGTATVPASVTDKSERGA
jgi:hypothetical protein